MTKEDVLEMSGVVEECLPGTKFRVKADLHGTTVTLLATLSGKMRKNNIRVLLGDRVTLEVSTYDISKGRIIFRHK